MTTRKWILSIILILLVGCGVPTITNHPKPDLKVDFTPFEDAGCPTNEYGYYHFCAEESELYDLGCDRLAPVSDMMGGLDPAYPMAVCLYVPMGRSDVADPYNTPESEYFFNIGGPMPMLVRYAIALDGEFQLVKNADEFASTFAPVESPEEALGFAIAVLDVYASYGMAYDPKFKYKVSSLEDTYVESVADGYIVHAFDYQFFGCGPHYYYAVDVMVTFDGQVEPLEWIKIYRDPELDDLCQD